MRILLLGDIVGKTGRRTVRALLGDFRKQHGIDFVMANGENAAGGFGLTEKTARSLFRAGVDVLTSGNHIWDKKEIFDFIDQEKRILRPANYPSGTEGRGYHLYHAGSMQIGVINLMGRVFSPINLDCPFRTADRILKEIGKKTAVIIVDIHAEATSEKEALGWYLDGRVSAAVGSHTHIQTADNRILPRGTAYITDLGRTGALDSVLGIRRKDILEKFLTQKPVRFNVAKGEGVMCGLLVELAEDGQGLKAERIRRTYDPSCEG